LEASRRPAGGGVLWALAALAISDAPISKAVERIFKIPPW
jgi:hypothetical protein